MKSALEPGAGALRLTKQKNKAADKSFLSAAFTVIEANYPSHSLAQRVTADLAVWLEGKDGVRRWQRC